MLFKKKITWHRIFDSAEEALSLTEEGRPSLFLIDDKKICVVRIGDDFFAVDDRCPHQGASLSEGYCEGKNIVCPWHHYAFSLENGRQQEFGGDYVETYPVKKEEEGVFVGIAHTTLF